MKTMHINVMAPLVVADPADPDNEKSRQDWDTFDDQLRKAKTAGVHAVSTDVWWGLVEPAERQYSWQYYDKLSDHIIAAGLKWVPIISLHQCGGNIGDTCFIPLPAWVWTKLAAALGTADDARYVSEQGHASSEFVSCWATPHVLADYVALFSEFQNHFAGKAQHIAEINISLGPAGELRYPSYNSHDQGTGFPTRGALQCYSKLARQSWGDWALRKYGNREGVRKAWGWLDKIEPPVDVSAFFSNKTHTDSQYGRDFFDWYSQSLLDHGRTLLLAAIQVFAAEGCAFSGIDLGAKFPGVHWRMGHWSDSGIVYDSRLAELCAGLIRTSEQSAWTSDKNGHGYKQIVALFKDIKALSPRSEIVLHFTCLEKADGEDADKKAESLANSLVKWVGAEARRQGLTIKGENALGWNIPRAFCWQLMRSALALPGQDGAYQGLTLLRITDVFSSPTAENELAVTIAMVNDSVVEAKAA